MVDDQDIDLHWLVDSLKSDSGQHLRLEGTSVKVEAYCCAISSASEAMEVDDPTGDCCWGTELHGNSSLCSPGFRPGRGKC